MILNRSIFTLILLILTLLPAAAQRYSDSGITGHVVEAGTGEHIPGITISIKGTSLGATTDASGHYAIRNITPGSYDVEARCVGYVTASRHVTVKADETLEINFTIEPDALQLDQVVVTGNRSEVRRRMSSTLVGVLGAPTLDLVSANSLADGLCFQPGVRVENDCQNCGFTQVRINGLDGHYSQILMNSRPVFSALTGVYGLEQIPANMIERVEVMRGGGSALFGSSAIGGTINIITRDPLNNGAEASHTLTSIGVSGSLDNNTTVSASVVGENDRVGMFVFGQNRLRDGYDHDGDGFTEIAQLKTQTLGFRAFLRTSERSKLTLEYHGTHEYRRGGDNLDDEPHNALVAEQTDHNIHAVDLQAQFWTTERVNRYTVFASMQNTRRKSYYGSDRDPDAYGRTHDLVAVAGGQYVRSFSRFLFMPSELTAGLEYNYNYLNDVTLGYNHDVTQCINIFSGYLQNEWRNDRWGFLVGARVDKHSLIRHAIVSPRANIRFNPSENLNFRLSYSTGFRSPQAYDEDFHVAIVGGERVVTVLAPDLKQESSQSVSASVDFYRNFGRTQTNFTLEGFFTDLSDVFVLRQLDRTDAQGNTVLERTNGAGARVWGMSLEGRAVFPFRLQVQAGVTLQKSRYKEPEQWSENPAVPSVKRMFRTPDTYGYLTVSYNPLKPLQLALSGTYTGSMLVQHLEGSGTPVDVAVNTRRFFDLNFKVAYDFRIFNHSSLQLNAGIQNIFNAYQHDFDKGALRDSGYIYGPTLPRSIFAGLKFHI